MSCSWIEKFVKSQYGKPHEPICSVCSNKSDSRSDLLLCSVCHGGRQYCSKECLDRDWKILGHALICGQTDKRGREDEGEEEEEKRVTKAKPNEKLPDALGNVPIEILDMLARMLEGRDLGKFSNATQKTTRIFRERILLEKKWRIGNANAYVPFAQYIRKAAFYSVKTFYEWLEQVPTALTNLVDVELILMGWETSEEDKLVNALRSLQELTSLSIESRLSAARGADRLFGKDWSQFSDLKSFHLSGSASWIQLLLPPNITSLKLQGFRNFDLAKSGPQKLEEFYYLESSMETGRGQKFFEYLSQLKTLKKVVTTDWFLCNGNLPTSVTELHFTTFKSDINIYLNMPPPNLEKFHVDIRNRNNITFPDLSPLIQLRTLHVTGARTVNFSLAKGGGGGGNQTLFPDTLQDVEIECDFLSNRLSLLSFPNVRRLKFLVHVINPATMTFEQWIQERVNPNVRSLHLGFDSAKTGLSLNLDVLPHLSLAALVVEGDITVVMVRMDFSRFERLTYLSIKARIAEPETGEKAIVIEQLPPNLEYLLLNDLQFRMQDRKADLELRGTFPRYLTHAEFGTGTGSPRIKTAPGFWPEQPPLANLPYVFRGLYYLDKKGIPEWVIQQFDKRIY